jgi:hypothetical protein
MAAKANLEKKGREDRRRGVGESGGIPGDPIPFPRAQEALHHRSCHLREPTLVHSQR